MSDLLHDSYATQDFVLGKPALVCRWRLSARSLPLENRHLRAFAARRLDGKPLAQPLVAWAKQHIEWTLGEGSAPWPDGVLMLVVDEDGQAAMTAGPYEPLPDTSRDALVSRALAAHEEAEVTGVAPETLWLVEHDALAFGMERYATPSGAATLMLDLARTLGLSVERRPNLARMVAQEAQPCREAFLVSDEHGVVPMRGATGSTSLRFAESYRKLLASCKAGPSDG